MTGHAPYPRLLSGRSVLGWHAALDRMVAAIDVRSATPSKPDVEGHEVFA